MKTATYIGTEQVNLGRFGAVEPGQPLILTDAEALSLEGDARFEFAAASPEAPVTPEAPEVPPAAESLATGETELMPAAPESAPASASRRRRNA